MKVYSLLLLVVCLLGSQLTYAGRMGDAWKGSQSRIHGRFTKGGKGGGGGAFTLLMTSSTTISSLSSTALTSGGDLLKTVALRDEFLEENLYAVKVDSAKGQGEYLQTLASLSGCNGTAAQAQFASKVRSNFKTVYDGTEVMDADVVADHVDSLIENDPEMRQICQFNSAT
jgi:hypothetical protein